MSSSGRGKAGDAGRLATDFDTGLSLSDIGRWRPADKSLLVSVFVAGLVLYSILLLQYAAGHTEDLFFLAPDVLEHQLRGSYLLLAAWVLLGFISLALRKRPGPQVFLLHAPVQFFAISNAVVAYLLGTFTTPYGPVVLIGGILAALPLFGMWPTLLGAASWMLVSLVATVAEQMGTIPYAPLFTALPVVNGQLSTEYLIGIGSVTSVGVLLCAGVSLTAILQLRRREVDLERSGEELRQSILELNQSHAVVARANDELEARVQERTAALRTANERLQDEIVQRERAASELDTLRLAMEAAIEGVAFVGRDGRFLDVNAAFAEIHHAEPAAMLGTDADGWVDSAERWKIAAALAEIDQGGKRELTLRGLRPDGTQFSLELFLVGGEKGGAAAHYRFARDITEQEALAAQLNHATKMEAIGRLVGGIAHDFNNLLTAILSASEQLQSRFAESPEHRDAFELAETTQMAGTRAAELTRQLLDFAHLKPARDDLIDIDRSIGNSVHLLGSAVDPSIQIVTESASEPLLTRGDAARFDSGLLNLGLNARDAMPHGGELRISTQKVRIAPRELGILGSEVAERDFAQITIADTGVGIEAGNLTRVFEPFFTTKPPGEGTGLGLSVFDRYIREVDGALRIESVPGRGTVCSVYVPLCDADQIEDAENEAKVSLGGREWVLLAEDEPAVRRLLTRMLERVGYSVLSCSDGGEAVEVFEANHARVAAALLDFRMPVMNGAEVFLAFQRISPGIPVVLMSGNLSDADLEDLKSRGLGAVIEKPYTNTKLLRTLRNALDGKKEGN